MTTDLHVYVSTTRQSEKVKDRKYGGKADKLSPIRDGGWREEGIRSKFSPVVSEAITRSLSSIQLPSLGGSCVRET